MGDQDIRFGNCDFSRDISVGQNELKKEQLQEIQFMFEELGEGKIDISDGINGKEAEWLFEKIGGQDGVMTEKELMQALSQLKSDVTLEQAKVFKEFLSFAAQNFSTEKVDDSANVDGTNCADDKPCENKTVTVEKWGTGRNDCLSRIIKEAYPDVKLWSKEYYELETMVMNANPEIYGDENGNGGRTRIIDGTRHNAVLHTGDSIILPPWNGSQATVNAGQEQAQAPVQAPAQAPADNGAAFVELPPIDEEPVENAAPVGDDELPDLPDADGANEVEKTPAEQYMEKVRASKYQYASSPEKIMEILTNKDLSEYERSALLTELKAVASANKVGDNGISVADFKTNLFKLVNTSSSSGIKNKLDLISSYLSFYNENKSSNPEIQNTLMFIYNEYKGSITFDEFCQKIGYVTGSASNEFIKKVFENPSVTNATPLLKTLLAENSDTKPTHDTDKLDKKYLSRGGFLGFFEKSDKDLVTDILKDYYNGSANLSKEDVVYLIKKIFNNDVAKMRNALSDDQQRQVAQILNWARN